MEWAPEQVDELKRLWAEGLPTAAIGRQLGITKNAVIGKVHRLGLPHRVVAVKRIEVKPKLETSFKGPTCHWPIGHPREPDFHFCGAAAMPGKPYCQEHAARAYVTPRPARSDRAA